MYIDNNDNNSNNNNTVTTINILNIRGDDNNNNSNNNNIYKTNLVDSKGRNISVLLWNALVSRLLYYTIINISLYNNMICMIIMRQTGRPAHYFMVKNLYYMYYDYV